MHALALRLSERDMCLKTDVRTVRILLFSRGLAGICGLMPLYDHPAGGSQHDFGCG